MEHLPQYHINMPLTQLNYPITHQTVNWTGELPLFLETYTIYNEYIQLGSVWVSVSSSSFEMEDLYAI